jgi:hypothetical protein
MPDSWPLGLAGVEGVFPRRKFKGLEWQPGLSAHIDAKRLSGGLATQPPDRPPDPGNGSPGAVGTATGAEVQSVLQRTTEIYRKPVSIVQSVVAPGIKRATHAPCCNSEGIGALWDSNPSDKCALFYVFEPKRVIGAVRIFSTRPQFLGSPNVQNDRQQAPIVFSLVRSQQ